MSNLTFSVCAMVREDANILQTFAQYYKALGASEILLYFDGTPSSDVRTAIPGLEIIACDTTFWGTQPEGVRPASLDAAQEVCYRCARAQSTADWLWITDADEFLVSPCSVSELLAEIPPGTDAVRIQTAEAVWGPGDNPEKEFGCTHFRHPLPQRLAKILLPLLYGKYAMFFGSGLVAHSSGKHFMRRDSAITRIGSHTSYVDDRNIGVWGDTFSSRFRACFVAHFDAVSLPRWREKWRRRYSRETEAEKMRSVRRALMQQVQRADASGPEALRALFFALNTLRPWQVRLLRHTGFLSRHNVFKAF